MIRSFKDKRTAAVFRNPSVAFLPPDIRRRAKARLDQLDAAKSLDDLRRPPGNRLEALVGTRSGQHSVRINDQWRLCFRWAIDGPLDVELVDYH